MYSPYGGLYIRADNFFYISGDDGSGGYDNNRQWINRTETHYISGDLSISLKTDAGFGGWLYGNLSITQSPGGYWGGNYQTITQNRTIITPDGYWGYFQNKKGPMFTVDGGFISTTYLKDNANAADTRHVRVSIETGQFI